MSSLNVIITLPRVEAEKALGNSMSALSKRAYGAHWITGTEAALAVLAAQAVERKTSQRWGNTHIEVEEARPILAYVKALGYWVTWDENSGTFRPVKAE